jgi:hypothetical protein
MKTKLGDVFEIQTSIGLAYVQYTHDEGSYGELIRVFDEVHSKRPHEFSQMVRGRVRFSTFFPVSAALRQKLVKRVSNEAISAENREFPWFRYGIPHPASRKVEKWFLWRGGDEYVPIENFTDEHRRLSVLGCWNFAMLVERLQEDWQPQDFY